MSTAFVDSWFYIALLDVSDSHRRIVAEFAGKLFARVTTTRGVLAEVANGLAAPRFRGLVAQLLRDIEADPDVVILGLSDELYLNGLDFYESRPDKKWSLTDCISFVVMREQGITEALTGDRHFEQSGFKAVFAK